MPKLVDIDGVTIKMYFKDHAPPHIHAVYGSEEVLIVIGDGSVYAGGLSSKKLALVQEYVGGNVDALLERWAMYGGA